MHTVNTLHYIILYYTPLHTLGSLYILYSITYTMFTMQTEVLGQNSLGRRMPQLYELT